VQLLSREAGFRDPHRLQASEDDRPIVGAVGRQATVRLKHELSGRSPRVPGPHSSAGLRSTFQTFLERPLGDEARLLRLGARSGRAVAPVPDESRVVVYRLADSALQGKPLFFSHDLRGDE
jgi:hypothetical protein